MMMMFMSEHIKTLVCLRVSISLKKEIKKERSAAKNIIYELKKDVVPLIPLVALVEFPPKKALLSNKHTEPPFSKMVCAADKPAKPPPMTITF